jgi:hypothetical protein
MPQVVFLALRGEEGRVRCRERLATKPTSVRAA